MAIAKVKNDQTLVRETNSNAILNVDRKGLNKYKEEREFKMRMQRTTEELDQLKVDMSEIKIMIQQLIAQRQ
jgi:hypothetical protein